MLVQFGEFAVWLSVIGENQIGANESTHTLVDQNFWLFRLEI